MKYEGVFIYWYDAWVGFFLDRKRKRLYVCPVPCVVFVWSFE